MSAAPGFLEFFILEASDYLEQLDHLLMARDDAGPDGDAMQRAARALRGTATMAKIPAFAELAAGVERVGRAMHDGTLTWEPALRGALIAAIDDLKKLLHTVRTWSAAEDQRARQRADELARYAPSRVAASPAGTSAASGGASSFLASEAANIAAGLELLTARAGDVDTAANVLRRVRALRGVAGVKEVAPLADTLESVEEAARGLESSHQELTPDTRRLIETAAAYLRALATALRGGGDVHAPGAVRDAFEAARTATETGNADRERVVPIAKLFYEDGRPGVVETSQHPPTTASERFRLELVSLGEHLRQVVVAARDAADGAASTRAQRGVRRALDALEAAAESFDERDVAEAIRVHRRVTGALDIPALSALDDLASVLTDPASQGQRLRARLRDLALVRPPAAPVDTRTTPSRSSTPSIPAHRPVPASAIDSFDAATALLDSGISALEAFGAAPMVARVLDDEADLVPIESLLYRGRGALERAVEIRDSLKVSGPASDPEALEELFDLLELARSID